METDFNPYSEWLSIPESNQPPNHYDLLGLRLFEDDDAVVAEAYESRCSDLHKVSTGRRGELAIKLIDEISDAYACLSNRDSKSAYDKKLGRTATPPIDSSHAKPQIVAATAVGEVVPPPVSAQPAMNVPLNQSIDAYREEQPDPSARGAFVLQIALGAIGLACMTFLFASLAWYMSSESDASANSMVNSRSPGVTDISERTEDSTSEIVDPAIATTVVKPDDDSRDDSTSKTLDVGDVPTTPTSNGTSTAAEIDASTNDPSEAAVVEPMDPSDDPESAEPEPPTIVIPRRVGSFVTKDVVLARKTVDASEPPKADWHRVPDDYELNVGDELLLLPTYVAHFQLEGNISLRMFGPARFNILKHDEHGIAGVDILFGRMLVSRRGDILCQTNVRFGETDASLSLNDAGATVAIEVFDYLAPGEDPEKTTSTKIARLNGVKGNAEWEESGQPLVAINPDVQQVYQDKDRMQLPLTDELPGWITTTPPPKRSITAKSLSDQLAGKKSIVTELDELGFGATSDVRDLVTLSLIYLDKFEPALRQLNAEESQDLAATSIAALRNKMASDSEHAKAVRQDLISIRGSDGTSLFRALWGYTQEQLDNGEANRLVARLDHDSFDQRLLAIENLKQITGNDHGYRPEYLGRLRTSKMVYWQRRIRSNTIRYAKAPSPLPGVIASDMVLPAKPADLGVPATGASATANRAKIAAVQKKLTGEWEEDVASLAAKLRLNPDTILRSRTLGFMRGTVDFQPGGSVIWDYSQLTRVNRNVGKWNVVMSGTKPIVEITDPAGVVSKMSVEFKDDDTLEMKYVNAVRGQPSMTLKRIEE